MNIRSVLDVIRQHKLIFFTDEEFAKRIGITEKSLNENSFRHRSDAKLSAFCHTLNALMKKSGSQYENVDHLVRAYLETKKFYDKFILGSKLLQDPIQFRRFTNYTYTTYVDLNKCREMVAEWSIGNTKEKKIAKLCNNFYEYSRKNHIIIDRDILFLMNKNLLPYQIVGNMSPRRFFEKVMKELYDLMYNNDVENCFENNIPQLYYSISDELERDYLKYYATEQEEVENLPILNVLRLIDVVSDVLTPFYVSQSTSEIFNNSMSFINDNIRIFDLDGIWQTEECVKKRDDVFWKIEFVPNGSCYKFFRYNMSTNQIVQYDEYLMVTYFEDDVLKLMIGQYDYSYKLVTTSKIPNDTLHFYSCPNIKYECDLTSFSRFYTQSSEDNPNDVRWKVFSNKTFVKLPADLQNVFEKRLEKFSLENAHPEYQVDMEKADFALTSRSIFVRVKPHKENKFMVLRIDKYNDDFDEVIDGIESVSPLNNILIATLNDGTQYLGFDELNVYLNIDEEIEKSVNNLADALPIHLYEMDKSFELLFS